MEVFFMTLGIGTWIISIIAVVKESWQKKESALFWGIVTLFFAGIGLFVYTVAAKSKKTMPILLIIALLNLASIATIGIHEYILKNTDISGNSSIVSSIDKVGLKASPTPSSVAEKTISTVTPSEQAKINAYFEQIDQIDKELKELDAKTEEQAGQLDASGIINLSAQCSQFEKRINSIIPPASCKNYQKELLDYLKEIEINCSAAIAVIKTEKDFLQAMPRIQPETLSSSDKEQIKIYLDNMSKMGQELKELFLKAGEQNKLSDSSGFSRLSDKCFQVEQQMNSIIPPPLFQNSHRVFLEYIKGLKEVCSMKIKLIEKIKKLNQEEAALKK